MRLTSKEWANYKRSARCKKTVALLTKDLDLRISQVIETRLGKDSETWVHPEIAIDFAEWLSPEFSSFVRRIFIRYLKGDRARRDKIYSRSIQFGVDLAKLSLGARSPKKTAVKAF
jgi:hypothetical protein